MQALDAAARRAKTSPWAASTSTSSSATRTTTCPTSRRNRIRCASPKAHMSQLSGKFYTYTLELLIERGLNKISLGVVDQISNTSGFTREQIIAQNMLGRSGRQEARGGVGDPLPPPTPLPTAMRSSSRSSTSARVTAVGRCRPTRRACSRSSRRRWRRMFQQSHPHPWRRPHRRRRACPRRSARMSMCRSRSRRAASCSG